MLPSSYWLDITCDIHEQTGHVGLAKHMHIIQGHDVWPRMQCKVQWFIDRCGLCRVNNAWPIRPPMGEMAITICPGQIVGIDLMGLILESSLHQCHYLCVVINHYSGWMEAYHIKVKSKKAFGREWLTIMFHDMVHSRY